jgi:hypothetical protein
LPEPWVGQHGGEAIGHGVEHGAAFFGRGGAGVAADAGDGGAFGEGPETCGGLVAGGEAAGGDAVRHLVLAHLAGIEMQPEARLRLARMLHAGLGGECGGDGGRRQLRDGGGDDGDAEFMRELARGDGQRLDIAAVGVEQEQALEAIGQDGARDAAQHGGEGGVVQADRAAEGEMVLREARPHRRQHHRLPLAAAFRAGDRDGMADEAVGPDRQVGPVLLQARHRQHHHGVLRRERAEFRRGQAVPSRLGHAVLLRAAKLGATGAACKPR